MAWTIDESRVSPFLTAAERRDVTWTLWRLQTRQRALHGTEATTKPFKDGKEGKDTKDGKERKDGKEGKEGKDRKDGKDRRDYERWAEPPHVLPRLVRNVTGIAPCRDEPDDILAILRASRATRFLRERGLVI